MAAFLLIQSTAADEKTKAAVDDPAAFARSKIGMDQRGLNLRTSMKLTAVPLKRPGSIDAVFWKPSA
jgi:hypothetical protein